MAPLLNSDEIVETIISVDDREIYYHPILSYNVPSDWRVFSLRGKKMRSVAELMNEVSAALQFEDMFGENWRALGDLMGELHDWIDAKGFLLVITNSDEILQDEENEFHWFEKILLETGIAYSNPIADNGSYNREAMPFRVIFRTNEKKFNELRKKFSEVDRTKFSIRTQPKSA